MSTAISRAASTGGDFLILMAVILGIPFAILAVGIPIALVVQVFLQIGRWL